MTTPLTPARIQEMVAAKEFQETLSKLPGYTSRADRQGMFTRAPVEVRNDLWRLLKYIHALEVKVVVLCLPEEDLPKRKNKKV